MCVCVGGVGGYTGLKDDTAPVGKVYDVACSTAFDSMIASAQYKLIEEEHARLLTTFGSTIGSKQY